jgi:Xaa-Pro aminopeptidase
MSKTPNHTLRIDKVREQMKRSNIGVLLVSEAHNIFYLSGSNGGYTGARIMLLVGQDETALLIDSRYIEETRRSAYADRIEVWKSAGYADIETILRSILKSTEAEVGFDENNLTVKQYSRLESEIKNIKLKPVTGLVEAAREIKDELEIEKISEAARIADKAFDHILGFIRPGLREIDIALELDYFMRKSGAERESFDTIAASGPNSAVPHATPSKRQIAEGDFLKLDFGAVVDGYHSDMTRTVVIGKAAAIQREIYMSVKIAQEEALKTIKPGLSCSAIDKIARDIIAAKGFEKCFIHNLGHGVGLEIHEAPSLGKGCETVLTPGMIATVEPGIYVEGFGGVRIEDLVLVTEDGYKVLSKSSKELIELQSGVQ